MFTLLIIIYRVPYYLGTYQPPPTVTMSVEDEKLETKFTTPRHPAECQTPFCFRCKSACQERMYWKNISGIAWLSHSGWWVKEFFTSGWAENVLDETSEPTLGHQVGFVAVVLVVELWDDRVQVNVRRSARTSCCLCSSCDESCYWRTRPTWNIKINVLSTLYNVFHSTSFSLPPAAHHTDQSIKLVLSLFTWRVGGSICLFVFS